MNTGKASVMLGFNQPLEIREYPLPKEIEKGAIFVKMVAAGICGTDVHTWVGQTGGKILNFPVILGHENVGEVVEIGGDVEIKAFDGSIVKKGDLITWPTTVGTYCYDCANCRNGIPNKCSNRKTYGAGISSDIEPHFFGGWAEYCYLFPKTSITILPKNIDPKTLVATGCALPTAVHAAERAGINIGDSVIVQGSGAVGLMTALVAKESGANKVIIVGGPAPRLELAQKWGIDETINLYDLKTPEERIAKTKEICNNIGADVVFECSGFPNAFSEGVQMIRDGGTYVVVGQFMDAGPADNFHPFHVTFKHCTIKGSYSWLPRHTFRAVQFLEKVSSKYELDKLVSHEFPLEEVNEALLSVKNFVASKAVLTFK
ncbi:MAG: alcohol dehydrogenase [Firmicutes bacterium]|nr:alcohol dehydrogenase [Bacillota bacterium]